MSLLSESAESSTSQEAEIGDLGFLILCVCYVIDLFFCSAGILALRRGKSMHSLFAYKKACRLHLCAKNGWTASFGVAQRWSIKRKRRCDGAEPCSTCIAASRAHECTFRHEPRRRKSTMAVTSSVKAISSSSVSSKRRSGTDSGSQPHTPDRSPSIEPPPLTFDASDDAPNMLAFLDFIEAISEEEKDWSAAASKSTTTASSSNIDLPALPQFLTLDEPPSSTFPILYQPTPKRSAELFQLRNLFLDNSWRYGLNTTAEKRDALSRGDTSGLIVHPVLVTVCELLGYQLSSNSAKTSQYYDPHLDPSPAPPVTLGSQSHITQSPTSGQEAELAMTIFDVLHREASTMPSTTLMQVYNMLGVYYGMRGDVAMYRQLFNKLGAILLTTTTTKPSLACDDDLFVLDPSSSMDPASYYPQTAAQEWRVCCLFSFASRSAFSANIFLDLAVSLNRVSTPVFDPALLLTFRKLAIHIILTSCHLIMGGWYTTRPNYQWQGVGLPSTVSSQSLSSWRAANKSEQVDT
ncbi:hypothetical protein R3P38DRAFT_3602641 [Favolaschia claudopus]|uniref:Uncharacterized protein n=1 Tax=Favolaschia claudopus TaxID=2862362 RepID=A0AAW0ABB8_9AGAR